MDWNKAHNIYTTIQIYNEQIENLTKLADQIAEDRKEIEIDISHILASTQKQQSVWGMGFMQQMKSETDRMTEQQQEVDIEPFNMKLNDERALEFIGGMLHVLRKQRQRLQEKLTQMEENNV